MKLNHLNLAVTDPMETHDLLERCFELRSLGGDKNMAFLQDDGGAVLSLTSIKVAKETEVSYLGGLHIGLIQESRVRVNEVNERLKNGGYEVLPPSEQHGL